MRQISICICVVLWITLSCTMLFAQQSQKHLEPSDSEQGESINPRKTVEMTDIHDIKPPEKLGFDTAFFYYMLMAVFVLLLLIAISLYWKKRRKSESEAVLELIPPDVTAFRLLEDLENEERIDEKRYYFRLSSILRHYIQGRYGINAPEMTTEEFLPRIEDLGLHVGLQTPLRALLLSAEPIKFSKSPAGENKMQNDLIFVREFVKQTSFASNSEESADV